MQDETELMTALCSLAETKKEYDRFSAAIRDVNSRGYGIVMPEMADLLLEEPEIVKQAGGFGVRLRATAPSIHMIKTNISAEVHPIVGTEQQSEELVRYLTKEFTENPDGIWDTNMLGRTLYDLMGDSLAEKMGHMPEDAREKFGETLSRIINEGASGLVCIIL
ncbi:MAG: stage IV sporulation protein A, partial [Clostridia bacterium]|nr:stage IV sporulation protein A [Clostridia bacterium]